jgi:hypothetical protein
MLTTANLKGSAYMLSGGPFRAATVLLHVLQTLRKETDDVVVVEAVVDEPALAARANQAQAAEQPELMRHRRFARPEEGGEIADAQLGPRKRVEHADARDVAQRLEGFGEGGGVLVAQQLRTDGGGGAR